ncbi:unannotated protein [freshwater metagenome]|uniref:Unannotated protein n=1 Tax=freshwater metagenome TaxID=449393 RepID=A0A6J7JC13_9ZZZZ|nr:AMP-binding protein [Actinomycetota bacterium]
MIVDAWLARAAAAGPERLAVGDLTYRELLRGAQSAARRLAARGVQRGDEVALVLDPSTSFAVALHATLLLGAVAVPIDPRLAPDALARRLERCVLVVDGDPQLLGPEAPDCVLDDVHDLAASAVIVHTSGTSGAGTPVHLTYGNWLWSSLGSAVALGVDSDERWLCCLPVSHVGGLSILLRSAIYGTQAIVHERFDERRVLAALRDPAGPTLISLVPTTLSRLLDAGLRAPPALRWALLGGAPAGPALLEGAAQAGVPVAPTYGMTEACSQIATFGAPLFCTSVRIGPGDEILASGPTITPDVGPVLHTGDRGALDAHGRLVVTGRLAETIITGGENVLPGEVEEALEAHPLVAEAAVFGRPDSQWGEAVVAVVVARDPDGAELTSELLGAWCRARLAPHQRPKEIRIVAALPRTPSGKLLRSALA